VAVFKNQNRIAMLGRDRRVATNNSRKKQNKIQNRFEMDILIVTMPLKI